MRCARLGLMVLGLLLAFAGPPAYAQAAAPPAAPPAAWTASDCEACHDKATSPTFARTKHATLDQSCASCHPNVAEHLKAQSAGDANAPVPTLKTLSARELSATCLACHEKDGQTSWLGGVHDRRNVACTDCHGVHDFKSAKAQLKSSQDADDVLHLPQVSAREGHAHLPPPGARGKDGLLELPQPA